MKKNNLCLISLLSILMISGCNNNKASSSNNKISSSISSSEVVTSLSSSNVVLPYYAQEFVDAVNNIVLDENAGIYINAAWELYDSLGTDFNYPEVYEAYYRLIYLEDLYNDYLRINNMALDFISKVDAIPYDLKISDERLIVIAEEAYKDLTNAAKEIIGVSQAYERLVRVRAEFDMIYTELIEGEKREIIDAFLEIVNKIPSLDVFAIDDYIYIEEALIAYETLSEEYKSEPDVIEAYEKIQAALERYDDLINNPELIDDLLVNDFLEALNALPETIDIKVEDHKQIMDVYNKYKLLTLTAKTRQTVIDGYNRLKNILDAFYTVYLNSVDDEKDNTPDPDGVIEISNYEELINIKNDLTASYKLVADIDLENREWSNLGTFKGILDGNGHTIYNMACTSSLDSTFGLFKNVQKDAVVKDLCLEGIVNEAGSGAGAICVNNSGTISNCLINLTISSSKNGAIGGICFTNNASGVIENCIVLSNIQGGKDSGGVASLQFGTITETYFIEDNISTKLAVGTNATKNQECVKSIQQITKSDLYKNFNKTLWCVVDGSYPSLIPQ